MSNLQKPPPYLDENGKYIKFSLLRDAPTKATDNTYGKVYDKLTETN